MFDDKKVEQEPMPQKIEKIPLKPSEIIGKIDVHDTRERRDGPGGN